MNAERKFLFACLIFALVIYAIHAFGLFDLLTDLPHLQTLIRQSGFFGYSSIFCYSSLPPSCCYQEAYW